MTTRLLLAADAAPAAELAAQILFYRPTVAVLDCVPEAAPLRLADARADLVVLAVGPRPDRLELLARIRRASSVPLVDLAPDEPETLRSLEAGADLALAQPVQPRALVTHLDALLRRVRLAAQRIAVTLEVGGLRIDPTRRVVSAEGRNVPLTPTEFALLYELAMNAGRVVARETLLRRIWGQEYYDEPHYLSVYVSRLRAKLERGTQRPWYISTVRGVGYELRSVASPMRDVDVALTLR